jgi:hypothetical protein
MENKYLINGENFRIAILTKQNGKWVISQLSTAPVPFLIKRVISLGSKKESDMVSPLYYPEEVVEPSSIRVMLYMSHNYNYYSVNYKDVVSMNFQHYFKNVLPNEWDSDIVVPDSSNDSTKLYESLRAGALMVKSFGCYHTTYPWNPSAGADVNDQYTQFYYVGTDDKRSQDGRGVFFDWGLMCQDAFSYVSKKAVWDNDNHTAYYTSYGQQRQDRTYQYDRDGKTYNQIINLEYPDASIKAYTQ